MQIAIPVWQERVSPVFDTARVVLLVRIDNGRLVERTHIHLVQAFPTLRIRRMMEAGVRILICGAISAAFVRLCEGAGIRVIPWIAGPVERVLAAFLQGKLPSPEYTMPGCCGGRSRKRRRTQRRTGPGRRKRKGETR